MAHTQLKNYLEGIYNKTTHFSEIPVNEKVMSDGKVQKSISKEDMFSLETVILLRDLLDVEQQMLAAINKINTQQTVLEQKLNNLQTQVTQLSNNTQKIENNMQNVEKKVESIEYNTRKTKEKLDNVTNDYGYVYVKER